MTNIKRSRSGGEILVAQLRSQGVDHVFCVPGESYLAVLDALVDSGIQVTVCRQEGGAAMMAEAYGKLTGRPGICMVTRGPGVTNAFAGIHIAKQDSTPLIVFVGQIEKGMREREAFQEIDYKSVFHDQTKWTTEIDDADRIPELVSRAFHVAMSGRPGPVVIALPEDMLVDVADVCDAPRVEPVDTAPPLKEMERFWSILTQARRPLVILGGSRWSESAVSDISKWAGELHLPVSVEFRRQHLFSADHPCYVGDIGLGINPQLLDYAKHADVILLLGGRMSEVASQSYRLLNIPVPTQTLIHVHPDSQELNRVYQAHLAINASPGQFLYACRQGTNARSEFDGWKQSTQTLREQYEAWSNPDPVTIPGPLQMGRIMRYLADHLDRDAILTNGAGNYSGWVHRFHRYTAYNSQLAPTSGSMGYGVPAAVCAKRLTPDRQVISISGDGCFLMHGQEFATAVQYGLNIIFLVFDNGIYGTIRMHQEMHYPGRVIATTLKNPDFKAYAIAFGGHGERVETTEQFGPAFERAVASGKPALLHCLLDPQAITPTSTLDQIRQNSMQTLRNRQAEVGTTQ